MCLDHPVCLAVAYAHWWDPQHDWPWLPPHVELVRSRDPREGRPTCNRWYGQPAPVPKTATWALVQRQWPPGRIIFYTTRAAALWRWHALPLQDHPHIRLVPVERGETTVASPA